MDVRLGEPRYREMEGNGPGLANADGPHDRERESDVVLSPLKNRLRDLSQHRLRGYANVLSQTAGHDRVPAPQGYMDGDNPLFVGGKSVSTDQPASRRYIATWTCT